MKRLLFRGSGVLLGLVLLSTCGGVDSNAPTVLSVSPADGALGVAPDAEIVIVFSAPMDQASVEGAWISSDLPPSEVTFSWNAAGDTLTVRPRDEIPVAETVGLDPSGLVPLTVGFSIGAGADDLDGGSLAPFAVEFTTLRRLRVELPSVQALTNGVFDDGTPVDPASISIGSNGSSLVFWRLLVTFDLPTPPAGATLEDAVLTGVQERISGTPYTSLGSLDALHVTYTSLGLNAFNVTPFSTPGAFSTTATLDTKSVGVTAQVADDYANTASRGGRSQYRLQFATPTVADSTIHNAIFGSTSAAEYRSSLKLGLSFLIE